jgi:hypothetical protein
LVAVATGWVFAGLVVTSRKLRNVATIVRFFRCLAAAGKWVYAQDIVLGDAAVLLRARKGVEAFALVYHRGTTLIGLPTLLKGAGLKTAAREDSAATVRRQAAVLIETRAVAVAKAPRGHWGLGAAWLVGRVVTGATLAVAGVGIRPSEILAGAALWIAKQPGFLERIAFGGTCTVAGIRAAEVTGIRVIVTKIKIAGGEREGQNQ